MRFVCTHIAMLLYSLSIANLPFALRSEDNSVSRSVVCAVIVVVVVVVVFVSSLRLNTH